MEVIKDVGHDVTNFWIAGRGQCVSNQILVLFKSLKTLVGHCKEIANKEKQI